MQQLSSRNKAKPRLFCVQHHGYFLRLTKPNAAKDIMQLFLLAEHCGGPTLIKHRSSKMLLDKSKIELDASTMYLVCKMNKNVSAKFKLSS